MSSWFSSIFGRGQGSSLGDVNAEFHKEMNEKMQVSPSTKLHRLKKVGSTVIGTVSALGTINKITGGGVEATYTAVKDTVAPYVIIIKETAKTAVKEKLASGSIPVAETTTSVASSFFEGASSFISSGRSLLSWGWWGFNQLPSGMQFGLQLLGLYLTYRCWNSGAGAAGNMTVHVNIQHNSPACTVPEVKTNGKNVDICLPAIPVTPPPPSQSISGQEGLVKAIVTPKEQWVQAITQVQNKIGEGKQRWVETVKAVQGRIDAAIKLHKKVEKYKSGAGPFMARYLDKIESLLKRFQEIESVKYARLDVISLVDESRELIKTIKQAQLDKQREVVNIWLRKKGG